MIDQVVPFAIAAAAPPLNIAPTNFNPVPADGFFECWATLDELFVHSGVPDLPPSISITLGGATPFTPVPYTGLRVNTDGVVGAGPNEADRIISRQAVRQGTNLQINLSGGTTDTMTGRVRFKFVSMEEMSNGAGAVTS